MSKESRRNRTARRAAERAQNKVEAAASINQFNEAAVKAGSHLRASKQGIRSTGQANVGKSFAAPKVRQSTPEDIVEGMELHYDFVNSPGMAAAQHPASGIPVPPLERGQNKSHSHADNLLVRGHIDELRITKGAARYGQPEAPKPVVKQTFWEKGKAGIGKLFKLFTNDGHAYDGSK